MRCLMKGVGCLADSLGQLIGTGGSFEATFDALYFFLNLIDSQSVDQTGYCFEVAVAASGE